MGGRGGRRLSLLSPSVSASDAGSCTCLWDLCPCAVRILRLRVGSGLDAANGHRMSGRQSLRAQVSWGLGLGSWFHTAVRGGFPSTVQTESACISCLYSGLGSKSPGSAKELHFISCRALRYLTQCWGCVCGVSFTIPFSAVHAQGVLGLLDHSCVPGRQNSAGTILDAQ